ncbi:MAG: efflux RND transporter permease subunit, partial [Planctomycetota bacterium]
MSLSSMCVRRPIGTVMVTLIVLLLGGVAFLRVPVDLMPDVTWPTLSVSTAWADASPEEVEEMVSRPLEEALSAVPGVQEITSTSVEGNSNIRVTFAWGTNLDAAAADMRDRIDRVVPNLPEEADRPTLRKFDLASFPILILGVASDLDPVALRRLIDKDVRTRIERIPGVAALDIRGGLDREIHVNLDPERIRALGLSVEDVQRRLRDANITLPAGTIERGSLDVLVRTPARFPDLDAIRHTIIAERDGQPIALSQVARVEDRWEKETRRVRVNGQPGLRLSINKQAGTNTVEVARLALAELDRINADMPGITIVPIIDSSAFIQRAINNLGMAVLIGGCLAVLVLIVFLRNLRSTMVIAVSIPVAIIATFALMFFSGFTLNLMTLGGLALGVGMLVDNAIVVLENIFRRREGGELPHDAATVGSKEVTSAIIASTLTTMVAFAPMIFVQGMIGVMFVQLAWVVSFALFCSLIAALTLVPMLAARIPEHRAPGPMARWFERMLRGMEDVYARLLKDVMTRRTAVITGAVVMLGGSLALIPLIGQELLPTADEGEVRVNVEMQTGTRLEVLDPIVKSIEKKVKDAVPELRDIVTSVGGGGWRSAGSHTAELRCSLVPQAQRTRSSEDVANALRKVLADIPGVTARPRAGGGLFILRLGTSEESLQIDVRGFDLDTADAYSAAISKLVEDIPGVSDVRISRETGNPEEMIVIDRDRAADQRVPIARIATLLQTVLSGARAGDYRESGDRYIIRLQAENSQKLALDELLDLTVASDNGRSVALRNLVHTEPRHGPVRIERKAQERVVTISGNLTGERDLGSIVDDAKRLIATLPTPRDFSVRLAGDFETQQKAMVEFALSICLALLLVFLVMAVQFESLKQP